MKTLPSNPSESTKKRNPHLWAVERDSEDKAVRMVFTPPKRIRQSSKPLLNKLEQEWFNICVGAYPEGTKFVPQGIRFKLGNGIWYKPDLLVFGEKVYAYEVKGPFAHRGGFENLKVAAYQYPWIRWSLVWKDKQTHQWQEQEILP